MKITVRWIKTIFLVIGILFLLCCIYLYLGNKKYGTITTSLFRYRLMTVLSGSMQPAIKAGDMIIDKTVDFASIKAGDVITYKADNNILITHRVVGIEDRNAQLYFKTKGDANNVEDVKLVPQGEVVGRPVLRIPYGGYVSQFISSRLGIIIFILIPILILLVDQINTILLEIKNQKTV